MLGSRRSLSRTLSLIVTCRNRTATAGVMVAATRIPRSGSTANHRYGGKQVAFQLMPRRNDQTHPGMGDDR